MAYQGQARESRSPGRSREGARWAMNEAESMLDRTAAAYRRQKAGEPTAEEKRKETYTWFKDLYNFAAANKDNLDDPDVRDIIDRKMGKIEEAGFFTRSPQRQMVDEEGYQQMEPDQEYYLRMIEQMQNRFMQENVAQYGPTEKQVVGPQGYGQYQFDPIHGDKFLGETPVQVSEGSGLFGLGPKGEKRTYFERPKTPSPGTPSDLESAWADYNKRNPNAKIPLEEFKAKHWDKQTGPKGELTEKQKLDALWRVEQQIQKAIDEEVEITKDMVDMWNRQLAKAGLEETVTQEEVTKPGWLWDSKETKTRVIDVPKRKEGETLAEYMERRKKGK